MANIIYIFVTDLVMLLYGALGDKLTTLVTDSSVGAKVSVLHVPILCGATYKLVVTVRFFTIFWRIFPRCANMVVRLSFCFKLPVTHITF